MKPIITLLSCTAFVLILASSISSQPKYVVSAYGGLAIPRSDFGGEGTFLSDSNYFLENDYGMTIGVNYFTGEFKYAFDKNGHFRGVAGLSLNAFTNTKKTASIINTEAVVRENIHIFNIFAGAEYALLPKEIISPFIGCNFTANFVSGTNFDAETRFGAEFNIGANVIKSETFGFLLGMKYSFVNLLGKKTHVSDLERDSIFLPLNDEEFTYNTRKVNSKGISYMQFYAGVSFFLGQTAKKE
jgi:hypothetical protein